MTSEEAKLTEWVCVEETPDQSQATRVEAFLREQGVSVRVDAGSAADGGLEVRVPFRELARALAELEDFDELDEDERRG